MIYVHEGGRSERPANTDMSEARLSVTLADTIQATFLPTRHAVGILAPLHYLRDRSLGRREQRRQTSSTSCQPHRGDEP